jgi:hypothetical protein
LVLNRRNLSCGVLDSGSLDCWARGRRLVPGVRLLRSRGLWRRRRLGRRPHRLLRIRCCHGRCCHGARCHGRRWLVPGIGIRGSRRGSIQRRVAGLLEKAPRLHRKRRNGSGWLNGRLRRDSLLRSNGLLQWRLRLLGKLLRLLGRELGLLGRELSLLGKLGLLLRLQSLLLGLQRRLGRLTGLGGGISERSSRRVCVRGLLSDGLGGDRLSSNRLSSNRLSSNRLRGGTATGNVVSPSLATPPAQLARVVRIRVPARGG